MIISFEHSDRSGSSIACKSHVGDICEAVAPLHVYCMLVTCPHLYLSGCILFRIPPAEGVGVKSLKGLKEFRNEEGN